MTRRGIVAYLVAFAIAFAAGLGYALLTNDGAPAADGPLEVTVNGAFGAPVTIKVSGLPTAGQTTTKILERNGGDTIADGDPVLLRTTSFDSKTGNEVTEYDTGRLVVTTANEAGLGTLAPFVVGQSEGSRVLVVRPGLTSDDTHAEIVVVDLLNTTARGTPAALPSGQGLPGIAVNADGTPKVTKGSGEVTALNVAVQIPGKGQQVGSDDVVVVQYLLADAAGKVTESTWDGAGPAIVKVSDVFEGLKAGIVDQRVGSRVVIVAPAGDAKGDKDVTVVVDILAVLAEDDLAK